MDLPPTVVKGQEFKIVVRSIKVLYDCFGDFDGFVLEACYAERHGFRSRQAGIGKVVLHACEKRLTVSVWLDASGRTICKIVIHG